MYGIDPSPHLPPMANNLFSKMYEFATGRWLFSPEVVDDISRDVVHLAQMTQRIGQDHDDAVLKQYEIREKHRDLKGKATHNLLCSSLFTFTVSRHVEARSCREGRVDTHRIRVEQVNALQRRPRSGFYLRKDHAVVSDSRSRPEASRSGSSA